MRLSPASLTVLTALLLGSTPVGSVADDLLAYVNSGGSLPVHPAEFGEFWNTGFSLGGGVGLPITREWQLTTQFQFQRFGADGEQQSRDLLLSGPRGEVLGVASIEGRDLTVVTVMAEARFLIPSVDPSRTWFLSFGFGRAAISTSDAMVTSVDPRMEPVAIVGDKDAAFSSSIGGGVEIDISPSVRLTVDSIYTTAFTSGSSTQFLPLRLGLAFRVR